jgi:hypothetical protein
MSGYFIGDPPNVRILLPRAQSAVQYRADVVLLINTECSSEIPRSLLRKYRYVPLMGRSSDSSVGIALACGLDDRCSRVRFSAGAGNFSLHHRIQNGSGAHPASYPMGTRNFSLGVKQPGREANHSPPSSVEVKNSWSYTSTPQCVFMAWCLVKHRDNFSFTLTSHGGAAVAQSV